MSEQQELFCYKQMPVWTADEIPEALLSKHNTAAGTWGCLNVLQGRLNFNEVDEAGNITATHELTPESDDWIIHPQAWHFIAPQTQDTEIQLSFYCEAADYFNKKYGMSATHSAVVAAENIVPAGKALDMAAVRAQCAVFRFEGIRCNRRGQQSAGGAKRQRVGAYRRLGRAGVGI